MCSWRRGRSSQGAEGGEAPLRALLRRHKLGAALPESGSNKEVWRRTPRGASPIERRDRFTRALPYHESAPEAVSYPQAPCALLLLTGRVTKPRAPTVAGARCNMAAARLAVFPTRQNLQVMKVKLTGAKKGHSLLKKKADALSMRLRALLKNIIEAKDNVGLAFREGNFALAEVKYAAGDIKPMVIESVGTAQVRAPLCVDAKCMPARLACVHGLALSARSPSPLVSCPDCQGVRPRFMLSAVFATAETGGDSCRQYRRRQGASLQGSGYGRNPAGSHRCVRRAPTDDCFPPRWASPLTSAPHCFMHRSFQGRPADCKGAHHFREGGRRARAARHVAD